MPPRPDHEIVLKLWLPFFKNLLQSRVGGSNDWMHSGSEGPSFDGARSERVFVGDVDGESLGRGVECDFGDGEPAASEVERDDVGTT